MFSDSYELLVRGEPAAVSPLGSTGNSYNSDTLRSAQPPAGNSIASKPPGGDHHGLGYMCEAWKWEGLACVLALAMPFVMVATLYPHAGQPLPQWPFQITINALLSVYSVALRAAVGFVVASCVGQLQWSWFAKSRPLYDVARYSDAGQGAWGSVRWICTHHVRQPLTAVGALILILSVALDPFIQQLVRATDCKSLAEEIAGLPRTNVFFDTTDDPTFGQDFSSAVKLGVVAPGTGVEASCSTGNCTFSAEYGTVGYCSYCEDSSAQLSVVTTCSPQGNNSTPALPSDCPDNSTFSMISSLPESDYMSTYGPGSLNVTYSLTTYSVSPTHQIWEYGEDGIELFKMDVLANDTENTRPEQIMAQMVAGKTTFSDRHIDMATAQNISGCSTPESADTWRCRGYGAATCSISPCIRTYNATVKNGKLTENLVAQSGALQWSGTEGNGGLAMLDTFCLSSEEAALLRGQGHAIDPAQRWLAFNATPGENASDGSDMVPTEPLFARGCLYFMDTGFVKSMGVFVLQGYFMGSLKGVGGNDDAVRGMSISKFEGNEVVQGVYNSDRLDMDHISSVFANISESLTTYLRTHGNGNYSADAPGQVYHYATCLDVQWPWIAFPAAISLLTVLLFSMVVGMTDSKQQAVWKASPLVWILRGPLGGGLTDQQPGPGHVPTLAEIEKTSKELVVSMK